MQFAIDIPHFGPFSDPHLVAELAHEAEEAGWDGFFLWDHINYKLVGATEPTVVADPWIRLAAIALRTKRIKLGQWSRRRPWKLARETVTLDQLSGGRLILGIGLGSDRSGEYYDFGETTDARVRGEMLDEGLDVLKQLWSGEEFSYEGKSFLVKNEKQHQKKSIPGSRFLLPFKDELNSGVWMSTALVSSQSSGASGHGKDNA